jgi:hypothetical protein
MTLIAFISSGPHSSLILEGMGLSYFLGLSGTTEVKRLTFLKSACNMEA